MAGGRRGLSSRSRAYLGVWGVCKGGVRGTGETCGTVGCGGPYGRGGRGKGGRREVLWWAYGGIVIWVSGPGEVR